MLIRLQIDDSIGRRKSTFLADPRWRPPLSANPQAALYDVLLNLASELPYLLEHSDSLQQLSIPHEVQAAGTNLLHLSYILERNLQEWYALLEKQISEPLLWAESTSSPNTPFGDGSSSIFPTAFHFANLSVALVHLRYWSTLILIYQSILQIDEKLESALTGQRSFTLLKDESRLLSMTAQHSNRKLKDQIDKLSRYICESIGYCHQEEMGGLGTSSTLSALWVAHQVFRNRAGPESAWCIGVLVGMGKSGLRLATQLARTISAPLGNQASIGVYGDLRATGSSPTSWGEEVLRSEGTKRDLIQSVTGNDWSTGSLAFFDNPRPGISSSNFERPIENSIGMTESFFPPQNFQFEADSHNEGGNEI